jgi:hypothetical protein
VNFTVIDVPQRSAEWYAARLGRLTGSCAADMLATVKSGEAAGRRNLRVRLVLERLTGQSQESDFVSVDMQNGIDREAEAFAYYEAVTGHVVQRVGFLQHNALMAGCSPDGILGAFEGHVSIKCPKPATHLDLLKSRKVPTEYLRQITHECWISGAGYVDFLSYQPQFPGGLASCLVRVERKDLDLGAYEKCALAFLAEVDRELEAIHTLTNLTAVLEDSLHVV